MTIGPAAHAQPATKNDREENDRNPIGQNPKHEARKPKQIQSTNREMTKTKPTKSVSAIGVSFIRACFEFRASDFVLYNQLPAALRKLSIFPSCRIGKYRFGIARMKQATLVA